MAELASAYPSTGGQYHFAFMVSPPKSRAFIAFVMGWLSVLAWVLTTTSAAIFCGKFNMVPGLNLPFVLEIVQEVWKTISPNCGICRTR